MNVNNLLIGAGSSGLLMAHVLKRNAMEFFGLDEKNGPHHRFTIGCSRLWQRDAIDLFSTYFPSVEWLHIEEPAFERKKHDWCEISDITSEEKYFFGGKYAVSFIPERLFQESIRDSVKSEFVHGKRVVEVNLQLSSVKLNDQTEIQFGNLLWCAPTMELMKVLKESSSEILKFSKHIPVPKGGILLELWLKSSFANTPLSMLFSFRHKEEKLKAFGIEIKENQTDRFIQQWVLFLENDLREDKEEVAKRVRTLKRELFKEFNGLEISVESEKIVYFSNFPNLIPRRVDDLKVGNNLYILNGEFSINEAPECIGNLEASIQNATWLLKKLQNQTT